MTNPSHPLLLLFEHVFLLLLPALLDEATQLLSTISIYNHVTMDGMPRPPGWLAKAAANLATPPRTGASVLVSAVVIVACLTLAVAAVVPPARLASKSCFHFGILDASVVAAVSVRPNAITRTGLTTCSTSFSTTADGVDRTSCSTSGVGFLAGIGGYIQLVLLIQTIKPFQTYSQPL